MFGKKAIAAAMAVVLAATLSPVAAFAGESGSGLTAEAGEQLQVSGSRPDNVSTQSKKAYNKVIYSTLHKSNPALSKTVSGYDITGDGRADAIRMELVRAKYDGWARAMRIYVNGRLCRTMKCPGDFYLNNVVVKYLRTRNGKPFLFVRCLNNNMDGAYAVLQYRGGRLKAAATENTLSKKYGNHRNFSAKAVGNVIKVSFTQMTWTAGAFTMQFNYKVRRGVLKRASTSTSKVSYYSSYASTYKHGKHPVYARKAFTTYTNTKLKHKKFRVSYDQKVWINGAQLTSSGLYFRIKNAKGQTGWIRGLTKGIGLYHGETLFQGTMLAG